MSADFAESESPTTQFVSIAEEAWLNRGEQIRNILLDPLEQSNSNQGIWPERLLPLADGTQLVYTALTKSATPKV